MKFGEISWKSNILSMTPELEFESKNSFVHGWHVWLLFSVAHQILFLPKRSLIKYRFPSQFFILIVKSPSVIQGSVSQEIKMTKNPSYVRHNQR